MPVTDGSSDVPTIVIDQTKIFQSIDGFGGAITDSVASVWSQSSVRVVYIYIYIYACAYAWVAQEASLREQRFQYVELCWHNDER